VRACLFLLLSASCAPTIPPIPHPVAKPAGCPIAIYADAHVPSGITDPDRFWYFRDVQVECGKDEPKPTCVRRLQDRACAVGAELLYVVNEGPSLVSDGTVYFGKPALRR
jgi:hypothetical protein